MKIVSIDTQILSWAIVRHPPKGNEHLVKIATDFMNWVQEQEFKVVVPTIVISELLIPVPVENHQDVMIQLARDFRIVPFDIRSSQKFAEIMQNHIVKNKIRRLISPDKIGSTRAALKADTMILATALTHGAEIMFTNDGNMKKMAEGFIEAKNLTDVQYQLSLGLQDSEDDED